jgi:hypothetical protein
MKIKTELGTVDSEAENGWVILELSNVELKYLAENLTEMIPWNSEDDAKMRYAIFPESMPSEERIRIFEETRE